MKGDTENSVDTKNDWREINNKRKRMMSKKHKMEEIHSNTCDHNKYNWVQLTYKRKILSNWIKNTKSSYMLLTRNTLKIKQQEKLNMKG